MLKTAREKQQIIYKGIPIRLSVDFPTEILQARREWQEIKWWKEKTYNQDYPEKISFQIPQRSQQCYRQAKAKRIQQAPSNQLYNKC